MRYKYQGCARDGNGIIISGGTVSTYLNGTTTPAKCYQTSVSATVLYSVSTGTDGSFIFYIDNDDYAGTQKFKYVISHYRFNNTFTEDDIVIIPNVDNLVATSVSTGSLTATSGAVTFTSVSSPQLTSTIAIGTAPLVVTSTTKVANLNADTVDSYGASMSPTPNTCAVANGGGHLADGWGGAAYSLATLDVNTLIPLAQIPTTLTGKTCDSATTATKLTDGTNLIHTKIISIGDWNMDTNNNISVAHGLTVTKIRQACCIIRDDFDTSYFDINYNGGTLGTGPIGIYLGTSSVFLSRGIGGSFDSSSFDQTSYNRGWVTITYVD